MGVAEAVHERVEDLSPTVRSVDLMSQVARNPDEVASISPVSLSLLAVGGQAVPDGMAAAFGREVIDVVELSPPSLNQPPTTTVVLVWIPAAGGEQDLGALVRWASGADDTVGLIGCCTTGSRYDAENALAAGFDDVVIGEVSVRELAARVRALSRRLAMSASQLSKGPRFGSITLDPARHQMLMGGRSIPLTRTELAVVSALVAAQGRAISRADILDAAWGDDNLDVGERAVDNVIMRLRRKLYDKGAIVTVRSVGFRLAER